MEIISVPISKKENLGTYTFFTLKFCKANYYQTYTEKKPFITFGEKVSPSTFQHFNEATLLDII